MDIFPLLIFRRWYVWNGLFRIRSGFPCFRFRKLPKPARRCPDFLFSGAVCSRSASNTAAQSCCLTAWSDRLPSRTRRIRFTLHSRLRFISTGAAYSGSRRTDTSGFAEPPLPGRTARYFRCLPPVFLVSGIADPGGYALSAEF